jgi:hypothetical protein
MCEKGKFHIGPYYYPNILSGRIEFFFFLWRLLQPACRILSTPVPLSICELFSGRQCCVYTNCTEQVIAEYFDLFSWTVTVYGRSFGEGCRGGVKWSGGRTK